MQAHFDNTGHDQPIGDPDPPPAPEPQRLKLPEPSLGKPLLEKAEEELSRLRIKVGLLLGHGDRALGDPALARANAEYERLCEQIADKETEIRALDGPRSLAARTDDGDPEVHSGLSTGSPPAAELPTCGAVLGIDVGYSATRASTGACLLTWSASTASFRATRMGTERVDREAALRQLIPRGTLLSAIAIDGPLAANLGPVSGYRCADALLSLGDFQDRGSAAPASPTSPLHLHAVELANVVLGLEACGHLVIRNSVRADRIHGKAIVEAHPVPFLSTMIDEAALPAIRRGTASDQYYVHLASIGRLQGLVSTFLPSRAWPTSFAVVTDHDERAAVACALSALAVVSGRYVSAGDADDGRIVLAPSAFWGTAIPPGANSSTWAERELRANVSRVHAKARKLPPNPLHASGCSVAEGGQHWF